MTDFDEFENVFKWYCFVVGTLANTLALCLLFKRISTLSKRFFKVDSSDRHQQQQQQLEQQQHRHQHFLQVPSQSRFPTATTNNNDANNIATTTPTSSNTNKHYVTIRKSTLIERRYNQTIYLYYFGIIASDLVILLNWAFSQILIGHDSEIRLVVENDTFFASPSDFDFDSSEGGGGGGGGGFVTKAHQPNIITLTTEHYQPYLYLLEKSKYLNFTATHSLIPSAYDQVSPSSSSSSSSSSNFTSATGPLRLVDVDLVNRSTPFSLDTVNHSAMFFESIVTALNAQLRHSTIKLVDLQGVCQLYYYLTIISLYGSIAYTIMSLVDRYVKLKYLRRELVLNAQQQQYQSSRCNVGASSASSGGPSIDKNGGIYRRATCGTLHAHRYAQRSTSIRMNDDVYEFEFSKHIIDSLTNAASVAAAAAAAATAARSRPLSTTPSVNNTNINRLSRHVSLSPSVTVHGETHTHNNNAPSITATTTTTTPNGCSMTTINETAAPPVNDQYKKLFRQKRGVELIKNQLSQSNIYSSQTDTVRQMFGKTSSVVLFLLIVFAYLHILWITGSSEEYESYGPHPLELINVNLSERQSAGGGGGGGGGGNGVAYSTALVYIKTSRPVCQIINLTNNLPLLIISFDLFLLLVLCAVQIGMSVLLQVSVMRRRRRRRRLLQRRLRRQQQQQQQGGGGVGGGNAIDDMFDIAEEESGLDDELDDYLDDMDEFDAGRGGASGELDGDETTSALDNSQTDNNNNNAADRGDLRRSKSASSSSKQRAAEAKKRRRKRNEGERSMSTCTMWVSVFSLLFGMPSILARNVLMAIIIHSSITHVAHNAPPNTTNTDTFATAAAAAAAAASISTFNQLNNTQTRINIDNNNNESLITASILSSNNNNSTFIVMFNGSNQSSHHHHPHDQEHMLHYNNCVQSESSAGPTSSQTLGGDQDDEDRFNSADAPQSFDWMNYLNMLCTKVDVLLLIASSHKSLLFMVKSRLITFNFWSKVK